MNKKYYPKRSPPELFHQRILFTNFSSRTLWTRNIIRREPFSAENIYNNRRTLFTREPCSPENIVHQRTKFTREQSSPENKVHKRTKFTREHCSPENIVHQRTKFTREQSSPKNIVRHRTLFTTEHNPDPNKLFNWVHCSTKNDVDEIKIELYVFTPLQWWQKLEICCWKQEMCNCNYYQAIFKIEQTTLFRMWIKQRI